MKRCKIAVLALLMVLMPLRGFAADAMRLSPAGAHDAAMHQMAAGQDVSCCDHEEGAPNNSGGSCGDHDCCASFLAPAAAVLLPTIPGAIRIQIGAAFAAGFVPEHLDPPPLAL